MSNEGRVPWTTPQISVLSAATQADKILLEWEFTDLVMNGPS